MSQFTHGYALLIGVGQCQHQPYSLPVTVKDVDALRDTLTAPNLCAYPGDDNHIRVLTNEDATRQGILDGLGWLAQRCQLDGDATAIVHFSGHGMIDSESGRFFLVTHDVDANRPAETALLADDFQESLSAIRAKRLLVFLDCCHASAMASTRQLRLIESESTGLNAAAAPQSLVSALKQGEGRAIFSSSKDDQLSYELPDRSQGLFTKYLLEGLHGAGNQLGETEVTVSRLMGHISTHVKQTARKLFRADQTPFFETASEDFPIALVQGGRGLTRGQLDQLLSHPEDQPAPAAVTYQITNSGSGAVAAGPNSAAAGERGIAIGGDATGGTYITGDGNQIDSSFSAFNQRNQTVHNQTNVDGDLISVGDITDSSNIAIGRDSSVNVTSTGGIVPAQLNDIFTPLLTATATAPQNQFEAVQLVQILKDEVAKGADADDTTMARLIDGLVEKVPTSKRAVVNMFGTPSLAEIAGPVTKYALERIQES